MFNAQRETARARAAAEDLLRGGRYEEAAELLYGLSNTMQTAECDTNEVGAVRAAAWRCLEARRKGEEQSKPIAHLLRDIGKNEYTHQRDTNWPPREWLQQGV